MNAVLPAERPRSGDAARFFWTALVAFPINLVVLQLAGPLEWSSAALASGLIAWLAGLVGLCIPVRHKAAFIIPGVIGGLLIAFAFLWILSRMWGY